MPRMAFILVLMLTHSVFAKGSLVTAATMKKNVELFNKSHSPEQLMLLWGLTLAPEDTQFLKSKLIQIGNTSLPRIVFDNSKLSLKVANPDIVFTIKDMSTQTYAYQGHVIKLSSYKSLREKTEALKQVLASPDRKNVWWNAFLPWAQAGIAGDLQEQASLYTALLAHRALAEAVSYGDSLLDKWLGEENRPVIGADRAGKVAQCMQNQGALTEGFRSLAACRFKDKIEEVGDRFPKVGNTQFRSHLSCSRSGQGILQGSELTLVRPVGINAKSGSKSGYICYKFKFQNKNEGTSRYMFEAWHQIDGSMSMSMFDSYACDGGMIRSNTYNLKEGNFINQRESSGEKPAHLPWKIDDFKPALQLAMRCCITDPSDSCSETFNGLKTIFTDPQGNPVDTKGNR